MRGIRFWSVPVIGLALCLGAAHATSATVGDFAWQDLDCDGFQDAYEPFLVGAIFELTDCNGNPVHDSNGNPVGPQVTDIWGEYFFENLPPGDYRVRVTLPAGFFFTDRISDFDVWDSDINPATGLSDCFTLAAGDFNENIDVGACQAAALGDFVWEDRDRDGLQGANEPGIANAVVMLTDCDGNPVRDLDGNIATAQTTGSDGAYAFDNLRPGFYQIMVTLPAGYQFTMPYVDDDDLDSNIVPATGKSDCRFIESGQNDDSIDAGAFRPVVPPASLGDYIWEDLDMDGQQDGNEPGIAGATVMLTDCNGNPVNDLDGNPVANQTTGADGAYGFGNLPAGSYMIMVTLPDGFVFTDSFQGNSATDSNIGADGKSDCRTLVAGQNDPTVDAGAFRPAPDAASLGDYIWEDLDMDGQQDGNEPGIAGATVMLTDCNGNPVNDLDGNPVANQTTGADGAYGFGNLAAGSYMIMVTLPDGFVFTDSFQGNSATDSNVGADGKSDCRTLVAGQNDPTVDAGAFRPAPDPASLGDYIWEDLDMDGQQDANEPGIAGAVVMLTDCNGNPVNDLDGNPVANQTTGSDGAYGFGNLAAGSYMIMVTLPDGFVFTDSFQGNANTDSNVGADGKSDCRTLVAGQNDPTVDAGAFRPAPDAASLGDYIWEDLDMDGHQDTNEPGIAGAVVMLTDCNGNPVNDLDGNPVANQTTGADGAYGFGNLPAGGYMIMVTLPDGFVFTDSFQGNSNTDSNVGADGKSDCRTLVAGQNDPTVDAGAFRPVVLPASLGDYIWEDLDMDGQQDGNEPGIAGAVVMLTDCNGNPVNDLDGNLVGNQTTGADGAYNFGNLAAGSYMIMVTLPDGFVFTDSFQGNANTDSNVGADGKSDCRTLVAGQDDPTVDAGAFRPAVPPASLGDYIWEDLDMDGQQDANEPGIAGATVMLTDCNGNPVNDLDGNPVGNQTTGSDGAYGFGNLAAGSYMIMVTLPDGFVFSDSFQGNANTDSNVGDDGKSDCRTLVAGQNDPTVDAGAFRPAIDCDLTVDLEGCVILPPAPPGDFDCGEIDALTMIWDGNGPIRIKAWKGEIGRTLLADIDDIAVGDEVTVSGYDGSPNDVIWEVFAAGSSSKLGDSTFHLSCSDDDMDGPEDCGKRQGNGKRNDSGFINDWLLEGLDTDRGAFDCTPNSGGDDGECVTEIPVASGDACDGKVERLVFRYTGEDCSATQHMQDSNKVSCNGDPAFAGMVRVRVTDKSNPNSNSGRIYFDGTVALGESFEATAANANTDKFKSETFAHIFAANGDLLQTVRFHTSCSQPLAPGNQFGSLLLTGMETRDGGFVAIGTEVEYTYTITNNSAAAVTNVAVIDDTYGEIPGSPIASIASGETVVLMLTVDVSEETTNMVTVSGSLGGAVCEASDSATITIATPPVSCCEDGKLRLLTMVYTGEDCSATNHEQDSNKVSCNGDPAFANEVFVRASDESDPNDDDGRVYFEGNVTLGASFDIDARNAGENKLKSETFIHVFDLNGNLLQSVRFHTSCSQPLFIGNQFGSMLVENCLGEDAPDPNSCCEDDGGLASLTMLYTGDDCSASNNQQDDDATCNGDPNFASQVRIRASNKRNPDDDRARVWFEGSVSLGESFVMAASNANDRKLRSNAYVHVMDLNGDVLQTVKFHVSCSQPIMVGNQFGSVQVVACEAER